MKGTQVHIIHRVNLDIEAPDQRSARDLQDKAVRILYNDILPRLEEWLDSNLPADQFIRLDSLDLHSVIRDPDSFEAEFANLIHESAIKSIEKITLAPGVSGKNEEAASKAQSLKPGEKTIQGFLHFLSTGRLPWWQTRVSDVLTDEEQLIQLFISSPGFIAQIYQLLKSHPAARERLLLQYTNTFIAELIIQIITYKHQVVVDEIRLLVEQLLLKLPPYKSDPIRSRSAYQAEFLRELLHVVLFTTHPLTAESISATYDILNHQPQPLKPLEHVHAIIEKKPIPEEHRAPDDKKKLVTAEEEGVYVNHAGIILLHPFFESLFKDYNLLSDGQFVNDNNMLLAAHLLQFLATGSNAPPEYDMTLEKYLCGIDLDKPVERYITLDQAMKDECDTLLKACIGHWKALKNTSPDGLREGFLEREGKLVINDFQHRLIVENKAHDLLLSYLPWGIGFIKLPWLTDPLVVDWNN